MSLYAIGDLHLSFSVDKPMDVFGRVWKNHEKKIWKYWNKRVTDRDTVVVTAPAGDMEYRVDKIER